MTRRPSRPAGFTLLEILTVLVGLVVLAAIFIPLWHTHQLRRHRTEAAAALLTLQAAQDKHFASHARYVEEALAFAPAPAGLGFLPRSAGSHYRLSIEREADGLGYQAIATFISGSEPIDTRCQEMRLDQHGRKSARDIEGKDTSADCWHRL